MATRRIEDKNCLDFFALCMSALGQKRTFRRAIGMSALAPKADYGCPPWANSGHAAKSQRTPANWRPYGEGGTAFTVWRARFESHDYDRDRRAADCVFDKRILLTIDGQQIPESADAQNSQVDRKRVYAHIFQRIWCRFGHWTL
jgi:hypothetical protein